MTADTTPTAAVAPVEAAPAAEPHALSRLEDGFLAEWRKLATYSETEAKKLLAWIASEL